MTTDQPSRHPERKTQGSKDLFHKLAYALLPLLRLLARKGRSEYFDPVEFLHFCCVGLANTLIDFCVYLTAINFLPVNASRALSWAAACSFSYMFNRRWVFHSHARHSASALRFIVVNILGLLFGVGSLELLIHLGLDRITSYVFTLPAIALGNYFGYKLWSFKAR